MRDDLVGGDGVGIDILGQRERLDARALSALQTLSRRTARHHKLNRSIELASGNQERLAHFVSSLRVREQAGRGERQLRVNRLLNHLCENLNLALLVIVLTAGQFDVDVTCHQLRTSRITQNFQHHRQALAFSVLEHILVLLRPRFGVIPAVSDDNCAHVVGRCVLAASSTRHGSQTAVHVQHGINQNLRLLLVQLVCKLFYIGSKSGSRLN